MYPSSRQGQYNPYYNNDDAPRTTTSLNSLGLPDHFLHQRLPALANTKSNFGFESQTKMSSLKQPVDTIQPSRYVPWPSDQKSSGIQLLQNAASRFDRNPRTGSIYLKGGLNRSGLVVFFAKWCGHCHKLADVDLWQSTGQQKGVLFQLDAFNYGQVPILLVDVDEMSSFGIKINTKLLAGLHVDSFPTIFVIGSDGILSPQQYEGRRDYESLSNLLASI